MMPVLVFLDAIASEDWGYEWLSLRHTMVIINLVVWLEGKSWF